MQSPIHISFLNHSLVAPSMVKAVEKVVAAMIFAAFSEHWIIARSYCIVVRLVVTKAFCTSRQNLLRWIPGST
jgi:hypothetical protein